MGIKMVFDERNWNWKMNDDETYCIIRNAESILNVMLKVYGFVRMHKVYELLHMPWGDDWRNELCRNNDEEHYCIIFENLHKNEDGEYEFEICVCPD